MDIRTILAALDPDDRAVWLQHRTDMRRVYLSAHNATVGIGRWNEHDDAMMDLIDIKLATLFDRAGRFNATEDIVGKKDASKIEDHIAHEDMKLSARLPNVWPALNGTLNGKVN